MSENEKQFTIHSVETVHRMYVVRAPDADAAKKRLRMHFEDPGLLRPGIIEKAEPESTSSRRIQDAEELKREVKTVAETGR